MLSPGIFSNTEVWRKKKEQDPAQQMREATEAGGSSGENVVSWKACEEYLEEEVTSAATRPHVDWTPATGFGDTEGDLD